MGLKANRERIEALNEEGITSREKLITALPYLIDFAAEVKVARKSLAECQKAMEALSNACAEYALAHESVFDDALDHSAVGVLSGDITIDDVVYHLAQGYEKPKRTEEGEKLSQDFLDDLPANWTRQKIELDISAINRLKVSAETLAEHGLYRPVKNEWSAHDPY